MHIWTVLGARSVAALTELLQANSTWGECNDRSHDLGHSVVYPLNASVTVGMIGAGSKLVHTQQLICSL